MRPLPLLLALLLVGCGASSDPVKVTGPKNPEAEFVDQMVAKAGGDVNKLSPEEKKKMDEITRGNTAMVLSTSAKK